MKRAAAAPIASEEWRMSAGRAILALCLAGLFLCEPATAQLISGSSLALRSTGAGSGTWALDRDGYVGTYIDMAATGNVTIRVNAAGTPSGGINPQMNLVLADTKVGFIVASGVNAYEHTFSNVPTGRYILRAEFANDLEVSSRALGVQDLEVIGANVLNSSSNANALAAADTYIQNFRRGDVRVALSGVAPGSNVDVSLKRHAFNFGAAVPGNSSSDVDSYLGSNGTAKQTSYQARLNQNLNALVPENAGKWSNNEGGRDSVTMTNVDQILNYAAANGMNARMHNLLWGDNGFNGQQPSWVLNNNSTSGLLDQAYLGTNPAAKGDLRNEISERIDYYVGTGLATDRAHKIVEMDIYNESFHTGADPSLPSNLQHNYWNVYGAADIASIYNEVKDTVAAAGAEMKVFVNEYGVLGGGDYGRWYLEHTEAIRQAGLAAGFGDVVDGIGIQHYPGGSQSAGNIMRTLQNLSVQDKPIALTEFGVSSGVDPTTAANILSESVRLVFGTANSTGFFMWGFHDEGGFSENMFAPAAALYQVANPTGNSPNWNSWTLTPAGHAWQDLLGIQDWDGNPNNGWTTQLDDLVVAPDGTISFNGFWGDYELTIDGQAYPITLTKGQTLYSVAVAPGDFNTDGVVDAGDYVLWRKTFGSEQDLRGDANGDLVVDDEDYEVWRSSFGRTYVNASGQQAPEPASLLMLLFCVAAAKFSRPSRRPLKSHP
jgi:GH35 family endo-1,4-beta-xylanase